MPGNSKLKILYIITKSVWGGAGKYVYDLASNLPKDEFEVHVAAGGLGELAKKIRNNPNSGVSYHNIKNFQRDINVFGEFLSFFEILMLFLKIKPDIIHTNSSKAGGIAGAAAFVYKLLTFRFKTKIIFTAHGWAFHEDRSPSQIFLIKFFSRLTALFCNKVICVSRFDYESSLKNRIGRKEKFVLIHNGIDMNEYDFCEKKEALAALKKINSKIKTDTVTLGNIGEFTRNKGHKFLIEAVEKLKKENIPVQAIIIGWGEEKENLISEVQTRGLENDLFILDNVLEASKYLKAFDIFVLSSLKEGFPYTLLEAGLAELPVVASRVGGIPEIILDKETGGLVEPKNTSEIEIIVRELLKNPSLSKSFAGSLRQKITEDFSFERMLKFTVFSYKEDTRSGNDSQS